MKKIFMILILMLIVVEFGFSNPFKLSGALELGYAPYYQSLNVVLTDVCIDITENIGYITFQAEVSIFNTIFIGGATKTYIQTIKDTITNYHPFESDYLFNAGIRLWNLEIGYRHLCLHPTRPYEIVFNYNQSVDAAYDEFYIRISFGK